MNSKSPMKVKEFKQNIQIEKLPFGKLVYSYTEKENNTGFSKNARLLLMDTISGMIGYYNETEIPTIPIENYENLKKKPMKKKAPIASMTYLKLRDKPSIQLKVKEVDFKGKKTDEKWSFNFKTQKIAEDWMRELDEAKKFITERPPIGQTMPPGYANNSYNQPMSMSVVKKPPIYPNELLTNTVVGDNKNQSEKLPIDRDQYLGSQLIYQTTDYNNEHLPIRSEYNPVIIESNIANSRLSGNRIPDIGSSSIKMTGSKIEPNLGTSHISNTNYNPSKVEPNLGASHNIGTSQISNTNYNPLQPQYQGSILIPASSGLNPTPTIPASSVVQPNPIQSSPIPNMNTSYSRVTPAPNYSRYSQAPIPPPVTISQSKINPKKTISLGQSNTGRPPIYESGSDRDWNMQFLNSTDPIETMMDFRAKAEQAAKAIIDEQGTSISKRKYSPWKKDKYQVYIVGSLIVYIAFLTAEETEYKQLKNEFRNYNYILNATQNRQSIKVPLAVFVDYKGVAALVKARIPKSEEISFNSIYHELDQLEKVTKVDKQVLKTNCVFHKLTLAKNTFIYIDDLKDYIPFDIQASQKLSQFRGEFIETLNQPLPGGFYSGKRSDSRGKGFSQLDEASKKMRQYGLEVATMIENMDITILNTADLTKQMHLNGVSIRCLGLFASQCDNPLIKRYFVSEIASRVCKKIIKSELQQELKKMQSQKSQLSNLQPSSMVLLDAAFSVLNDIVSQNDRTDRIWRIVVQEVKRKYNLTFSKEDLSVGYFLSSLLEKSGLTFNYQYLSKDKNYFRAPNCLRRDFVTGFKVDTNCYNISFTQQYRNINMILNSDPNEEGFGELVDILKLRTSGLPEYCYVYDLDSRIKWYMGNFISYGSQDYRQVGIYSSIGHQPPTLNSIKQSLLAIKWLKKNPQDQNGNEIFEVATDLISFWGGEYHPLLSDLYDFVLSIHATQGNYQSALSLAKSSLSNCIKIAGANSLVAGERYYQLGEVFFKMGKKEDALTNYQITRQILQANKATNVDKYGDIALKLAMLNLNFSKNSEAASKALEALRIFESPPVKQQSMLETYEVLARAYQISNQKAELLNLSSLCSKKLPTIVNPRVYERMLKVVLYPHMISLNQQAAKDLLTIYEQIQKGASQSQATQFLKTQTSQHSGLQFPNKLQKIQRILGDIQNKSLVSKYKGLSMANQGEAEQFLAYLEAIGTVLGDNFIMGVLIEASE